MVFRFILQYFANTSSEKLVSKMADSKPLRQAARMVVYVLNRTSSLSGSHTLPSNTKEFGSQVVGAAKKLSEDLIRKQKLAQEEAKRQQRK